MHCLDLPLLTSLLVFRHLLATKEAHLGLTKIDVQLYSLIGMQLMHRGPLAPRYRSEMFILLVSNLKSNY